MRRAFLLMILVLAFFKVAGQIPQNLKFQLQNSKPDTNRLNMLMNLGDYYLNRPSEFKKERVNAILYFSQAFRLSDDLHLNNRQNEISIRMGVYYFMVDDTVKGNACFLRVIHACQKSGDKLNEARTWNQFGDCLSLENKDIALKIDYYSKAAELFRLRKMPLEEMDVLLKIAQCYLGQGKTELAEKELLDILRYYNKLGYKKVHYVYDLLADVNQAKSDLHKELQYRLGVIKSMEASQDTAKDYYFYEKLAITYADLGEFDKSLTEVSKSLKIMKKTNRLADYYGYLSLVSFDLLSQGKPQAALAYIQKASREIPPFNIAQREDLYECYGNCYTATKEFAKAEVYYLALMQDFKKTMFNQDYYSGSSEMTTDFVHYNQTLGNFYVITKQYKKASFYLQQVLNLPKGSVRPVWLSQMHLNQFKVDSASGNYLSAINHYELHKRINDSLFNVVKIKQISEVQVNYQIHQKEESITMLENQAKLVAQKVNLQRKITYFSLITLLIIAGLTYYGYRNKKRSNSELKFKQIEINEQNVALHDLVSEKDKLLNEKDWLLNEVHHRVKNNLQIVMSLLNTQSAYLKNNAAIQAISDSQNRVQAISLIHQKLYQTPSVSNIDIRVYINDLVQYLGDYFDAAKKGIRFEQKIDQFEIEVNQAIPLGLILNEGITNAIKHAFDDRGGEIIITLQLTGNTHVLLTLADTGKGLPPDFKIESATTLGMEMMKVLTKQLGADFLVKNKKGMELSVKFELEIAAHDHPVKNIFITNSE